MSVLKRLLGERTEAKKLFCVVAGERLKGKTSSAGTLPGKTLLVQAGILESGSRSAEQIAKERGNDLTVVTFHNLNDLIELANELKADTTFDNVVIDGLSAITDLKLRDPDIQKAIKKNTWDGYRELGMFAENVILSLKVLTYPEQAAKAKNVFITCALKVKTDTNGNPTDVDLESKGQIAVTSITKLGEAVVTVAEVETEEGKRRVLLTRSVGKFPGRVDGITDANNPGMIDADLSQLLALVQS